MLHSLGDLVPAITVVMAHIIITVTAMVLATIVVVIIVAVMVAVITMVLATIVAVMVAVITVAMATIVAVTIMVHVVIMVVANAMVVLVHIEAITVGKPVLKPDRQTMLPWSARQSAGTPTRTKPCAGFLSPASMKNETMLSCLSDRRKTKKEKDRHLP